MSDRLLLYAAGTLRAIAAATTGVSVGAYLKSLGYGAATVGYVTSAGLAGATVAMLLATLGADRVGRRRALVLLSGLGAVGGTAVLWPLPALLLIGVAFFALYSDKDTFLSIWEIVVLGLVVAFAGAAGDLFESALKRDLGVKDSGQLLAGHGGMLDRVDSILFAGVASYYLLLAYGYG